MSPIRRAALPAALAAVLATSLWLHLQVRHDAQSTAHRDELPELSVRQPRWQSFDDRGRAVRELRAEILEKRAGENRARLREPRLELIDASGRRWHAEARAGWLDEHDRQLQLEREVTLRREPQPGGLVVNTDALRIGGRDDLIATDRPVVITSGNWHFTATGLRAEPGDRRLQLLENVRGIHD